MQVTYRHYFGAQEKFDLACFTAELICDPHEEHLALESGWLIHNGRWYQSRSTRIDLSDFQRKQLASVVTFTESRQGINAYSDIYDAYCAARGFARHYDPFRYDARDLWMEYRLDDQLMGFTKIARYQSGIESQFAAYIHDPTKSIGSDMLECEMAYAKDSGMDFLYIGSGYERSSIYKAHIPGFQWWTGSEWSLDISTYIRLCERDSGVREMSHLARLASDI